MEARASFTLSYTPRQELSLKKELDDIALQTIHELSVTKAKRLAAPLSNAERLKWTLEQNFIPEKHLDHRHSHPVFHDRDSIKPKIPRIPLSKQANVPLYNPLDKRVPLSSSPGPTNKYPYTKPHKVTTEELRKPRKTSTGVVPNPRCTTDISELNVVLEGQPSLRDKTTNVDAPISSVTTANITANGLVQDTQVPNLSAAAIVVQNAGLPKPAILTQTGTTGAVSLAQRPQPVAKPASIDLKKARRRAAMTAKKVAQPGTTLVEDESLSNEDERPLSDTSSTSVRSAKELIEEARMIAAGAPGRKVPSVPQDGAALRKHRKHKAPVVPEKTVRNVDEIIASLKTQRNNDIETEADRNIKEIMERVMKHANAVLGDIDKDQPETTVQDSLPDGEEVVEQTLDSLGIDSSAPENEAIDTGEQIPASETIAVTPQNRGGESEMDIPLMGENTEEDNREHKQVPIADLFDLKQAYSDLVLTAQVTHEDIVSIHGKVKTFVSKLIEDGRSKKDITKHLANVHDNVKSFLSKYVVTRTFPVHEAPSQEPNYERHVHKFCCVKGGIQMPKELVRAIRLYHTPDMLRGALKNSPFLEAISSQQQDRDQTHTFHVKDISEEALEDQRRSEVAKGILEEANKLAGGGFDEWRKKARAVFQEEDTGLSVSGVKAEVYNDESRLLMNCAPAKMSLMPAHVREHLFPTYYGAVVSHPSIQGQVSIQPEDEDSEEDDVSSRFESPEDRLANQRVLMRRHHSAQDLSYLLKAQLNYNDVRKSQETASADFAVEVPRDLKSSDRNMTLRAQTLEESAVKKALLAVASDSDLFPVILKTRCSSAPSLINLRDDFISIPEDYPSVTLELQRQRKQILEMKNNQLNKTSKTADSTENAMLQEVFWSSQEEITQKRPDAGRTPGRTPASAKPTLAEQALAAGRNYVLFPKKEKKPHKKAVDMTRVEEIERFLYKKTRMPQRRLSFTTLIKGLPERTLRVPSRVRARRRGSLPDILRWDEFKGNRRNTGEVSEREWARDIWNEWFDEVFPVEAPDNSVRDGQVGDQTASMDRPDTADEKVESNASVDKMNILTDEEFLRIEKLEPLAGETDDELALREALEEEAVKVTARIASRSHPLAFDYCRLGAIQRKLGLLKMARENLDLAIEKEPQLVHAYWQRHLLFLLQGKKGEALEDLNFILKINRNHVGSYVSRGEIVAPQDYTMGITNLTQAIKLQPTNADIYMKRAELYEKRDQILLAMEDYAKAYRLNPKLTIAIFRKACYYFKQGSWLPAINDLTEYLKRCPFDPKARMLRGRAYTQIANFHRAVQDLSAAIHLDPNNWEAFFFRGCIFRKAMPRQALLDYSVSVLINDSEENIKSLLHRGVLYDALGQPEDAIADFESILKLRKDVAVAHLNLGLIYLTKMESHQKAIRKFTSAIRCDPTFVRAYICRAEAYTEIHDHKNALLDYTRAIHLRPEVPEYYMHRGEMLLKSGHNDLAAFCVRHVSELFADSDLGQSATQQAVVHSFLKNYSKAITALNNSIKVGPTAPLFILLGKTQMKAKLWQDAITSFSHALDLQELKPILGGLSKPWKPKERWPKESAEVNYLIGLCCLELRNYLGAHDAFNSALEINSKHAEAFYQRGVAKLRLKQAKGLQDINKALAVDRKLFQAYLTRAAYYGMRGQYSKAVMNCNEAIMLKPKSVRAYLYRGALKYLGKSYELAIRDLTVVTKINSTCALAYFNRAVCYHESGQYLKALTDYGIVLLLGDQLILKVLINRGLLYLSNRDYKNALHDFLLAARVNNQDPKIRHTLGLCMHKLRNFKEAVAIFTEALSIDQFFLEAYISRGNAFLDYANDGGLKAAMCDYQRALMLNPLYLPARVNLAYSLQMSGRFQQAWNQFTTALGQDAGCQEAYEGRAIVNLQMSNLFGALQDVNASIKLRPTAELLTNRGVISMFMKDLTGAMHDFQAAIKNDPTYSLAYFNAANMYFRNRQLTQARSYYDQAVQFDDSDESAFVNRALCKVMLKDTGGALSDFSQAIRLSPKTAHIYFNRGNLFASLGNWSKADEDYCCALSLQPDDPIVYKRRADVRGKMGLKEAAVDDYKYAIQLQARIQMLKTINAH